MPNGAPGRFQWEKTLYEHTLIATHTGTMSAAWGGTFATLPPLTDRTGVGLGVEYHLTAWEPDAAAAGRFGTYVLSATEGKDTYDVVQPLEHLSPFPGAPPASSGRIQPRGRPAEEGDPIAAFIPPSWPGRPVGFEDADGDWAHRIFDIAHGSPTEPLNVWLPPAKWYKFDPEVGDVLVTEPIVYVFYEVWPQESGGDGDPPPPPPDPEPCPPLVAKWPYDDKRPVVQVSPAGTRRYGRPTL